MSALNDTGRRPPSGERPELPRDEHGRQRCPVCGNLHPDEARLSPGEVYCTPLSCPAWSTTAVFDHASQEWLPVDSDGYALDGVELGTFR